MTVFGSYANELENLLAQLEKDILNIGSVLTLNDWTRSIQISTGISENSHLSRNQFSKLFDYSATILNLYSFYEEFINSSTSIWLRFLSKNQIEVDYKKITSAYCLGVALVLPKIEAAPRYAHLIRNDLINSLNDAITPGIAANYFFEAFSADLNNLRLAELETLCAKLQLEKLREWLSHSEDLQRLCEEQEHSLETRLKDFIDRRNEVAHGRRTSEIYALRPLIELGEFVLEFCRAFHEFLLSFMLFKTNPTLLGKITEKLNKADAYIITTKDKSFSVDDEVYLVNTSKCKKVTITSLQVDHMQTNSVFPSSKSEIGIRFSANITKGSSMHQQTD